MYVPDSGWRRAASDVFEEMTRKGSLMAGLRRAELEHLEALLESHRRLSSALPLQFVSNPRSIPESEKAQQPFSVPSTGYDVNGDHEAAPLRIDWNSSYGMFDHFSTGPDDILALAEQLEHDSFSFTLC